MPKIHVQKTNEHFEAAEKYGKVALVLLATPRAVPYRLFDLGQFADDPTTDAARHAQGVVEEIVDDLVDIAIGGSMFAGVELDLETRERAAMAVCRIRTSR